MKKKLPWKKLILSGLAAVLIGGGILIWKYRGHVEDLYAQWGTGELIVYFHHDHGRFPNNWEEMRSTYNEGLSRNKSWMPFADLRERVKIDFDRLPILARQPDPDGDLPEVIVTASGNQAHYAGREPNQIVVRYFHDPESFGFEKKGGEIEKE